MKSRVLEPFHLLIFLCLLFLVIQKTHSQAITGLTAGFVNASTLSVSWDAASPSEKVSGYDVIILKEAVELRRIGVDNITSSIETSSLDQCRNYTVKVAANSTDGPGNYSTRDLVTKCVPPSIEHQPRIYVIARQDAWFPCDYRGFPTPSVYWTVTHLSVPKNVTEGGEKIYFNDVVGDILVQRELKVTSNGSLVIRQVIHSDSTVQYQCTAINHLGVAKVDVYLTVLTEYVTVNFSITFDWTNILNEHNQNGTLGEFLHNQFKAVNVSGLQDVSIICPPDNICAIVPVNSNTVAMVLSLTAAVTKGDATDSIEEVILKIADSKAIGLLTLKNVIIKDLAPPAPANRRVDENSIKPKEVVIRWDTPPYADVYELSSYSVEKKPLLNNNAALQTEKTLDAKFTELKMTGLKPDTAYVVIVKSHRKNSQKTGETKLEFRTTKDNTLTIVLAVVIPLIAIIIVVLVLLVIKFRKIPAPVANERRLTMDELQRDRRTYGPQDSDDNIYLARGDRIVALPETDFVRKWPEIPRGLLKLAEELGAGAFGLVRKGYLMRNNKVIECAVKMLKRHGTVTELRDLYNELNIMASVGNHPNIVSLIGACSEDGPLWVVVKFAENGSLLDYIRTHKKQPDYINTMTGESSAISNIEILQLAHGIAKGMNHLAKVKCVHRDLACRNVLLGKKLIPMVGDFGLARDIYESGAYETTSGGKLPVRWMALESLQDYSYTSESDVWSFGVVLWEIETGGQVPYAALGGHEIVEALKKGERLPKPDGCTNELYDIMLKCWHANPQQRLTFEELVHVIDSLMTAEADYLEILHDIPAEADDDTPYDEVRFDKIPEDYFWPSELRIHDPLQSRPGLVSEPRGETANGQVAPHAHDTGF